MLTKLTNRKYSSRLEMYDWCEIFVSYQTYFSRFASKAIRGLTNLHIDPEMTDMMNPSFQSISLQLIIYVKLEYQLVLKKFKLVKKAIDNPLFPIISFKHKYI